MQCRALDHSAHRPPTWTSPRMDVHIRNSVECRILISSSDAMPSTARGTGAYVTSAIRTAAGPIAPLSTAAFGLVGLVLSLPLLLPE